MGTFPSTNFACSTVRGNPSRIYPLEVGAALNWLGKAQAELHHVSYALALHQREIALYQTALQRDPANTEAKRSMAVAWQHGIHSYAEVLLLAVFLGFAGAAFAVALPLASIRCLVQFLRWSSRAQSRPSSSLPRAESASPSLLRSSSRSPGCRVPP